MQLVTTNSNKVGTTQTQNYLQTAAAHAANAHAQKIKTSLQALFGSLLV
jgi:hypothetical protein